MICCLQGLMFVFDSTDEASYESIKQQFNIYYLVSIVFIIWWLCNKSIYTL